MRNSLANNVLKFKRIPLQSINSMHKKSTASQELIEPCSNSSFKNDLTWQIPSQTKAMDAWSRFTSLQKTLNFRFDCMGVDFVEMSYNIFRSINILRDTSYVQEWYSCVFSFSIVQSCFYWNSTFHKYISFLRTDVY